MTELGKDQLTRRGLFGVGAASLTAACTTELENNAPDFKGSIAFHHGVASGDPTQTNVVIWTRVTPQSTPQSRGRITVNWVVSRDQAFKQVVKKGSALTSPDRDFTVKIDIDGLEPDSTYYYYFHVGKTVSPGGATRTLPAKGLTDFRLALVSCSHYAFGYFNVYREIAKRNDCDAVIHVGDYIYEYGPDGYGGEVGKQLGRTHEPPKDCDTLDDYRKRYAQYRTDPDLQAAHAIVPWFCTWDDHEFANNSNVHGAEHQDDAKDGPWDKRKMAGVQAYLEWMPIRDPEPGRAREAVFRKFEIGDLASLYLLETRLTARGRDIEFDEFWNLPEAQRPAKIAAIKAEITSPDRRMIGPEQEAWLADGFKASVAAGKKWQVLGNQTIMAKVRFPDLQKQLAPQQYDPLPESIKRLFGASRYGFEWSLDAWAGFPNSRERIFAMAKAANARLIVLTGDAHTAWANELHDASRRQWGVEFVCTSVTSTGFGDAVPYKDLNFLTTQANDEVVHYNAFDRGYTRVVLKAEEVEAEFIKVSTVRSKDYFASSDARFIARAADVGMRSLERSLGRGGITKG